MIERKIVEEKIKEFQIEEYVAKNVRNSGHSKTKLQKTPLGEKIVVHASRPGIVVGRKGENIKEMTVTLKRKFNLENPQIEIEEVIQPFLDASIVAENIATSIERFGPQRFKGIIHRLLTDVMNAGALGVEIVLSGKVPSARARTWRFYQGYLKKCGDISETGVDHAIASAKIKSGIVGIKVSIMPPTTQLPDKIEFYEEVTTEEVTSEESTEKKEDESEDEIKTTEDKTEVTEEKEKKKKTPAKEIKNEEVKEKATEEDIKEITTEEPTKQVAKEVVVEDIKEKATEEPIAEESSNETKEKVAEETSETIEKNVEEVTNKEEKVEETKNE